MNGKKQIMAKGFGLIETIIALSLFIIIGATGATTVLQSMSVNRLGSENTNAELYGQTGIEAVRSIKNQGWADFFLTPAAVNNCAAGCGVTTNGNSWVFKPGDDTNGKLNRSIKIDSVQRDENGTIVVSGGTDDPDTKKISSTVNWDFTPARAKSITLSTYVTHYDKPIEPISCDWSAFSVQGTYNFPGNNNAISTFFANGYAYVIFDVVGAQANNFAILDVVDAKNPVLMSTLALNNIPTDVWVSGNYAYVSSRDDNAELIIIYIKDKNAPFVTGLFDAPRSNNGMGLYVSGSFVYLVRTGDNNAEEFFFIDAR